MLNQINLGTNNCRGNKNIGYEYSLWQVNFLPQFIHYFLLVIETLIDIQVVTIVFGSIGIMTIAGNIIANTINADVVINIGIAVGTAINAIFIAIDIIANFIAILTLIKTKQLNNLADQLKVSMIKMSSQTSS